MSSLPRRDHISGGIDLFSTAADYLAFMRMILGGGKSGDVRLLTPESVALLAANRTGDLPVSRLSPAVQPAVSNASEFLPDTRKCWSPGFMVNLDDMATGRKAGSMAWAGGRNCYYWIDPASGIAGVFMTHILPFADAIALRIFEAFERSVYEAVENFS